MRRVVGRRIHEVDVGCVERLVSRTARVMIRPRAALARTVTEPTAPTGDAPGRR